VIAHAVIDVSIKKEQAGDLANVILIDMFQALACVIAKSGKVQERQTGVLLLMTKPQLLNRLLPSRYRKRRLQQRMLPNKVLRKRNPSRFLLKSITSNLPWLHLKSNAHQREWLTMAKQWRVSC